MRIRGDSVNNMGSDIFTGHFHPEEKMQWRGRGVSFEEKTGDPGSYILGGIPPNPNHSVARQQEQKPRL